MPNEARSIREAEIAREPLVSVSSQPGLFQGTAKSAREIWSHRELLVRLVKREVKGRYKDSSLGLLWSLFRPIVQLLIYYFAIGQVLGAARGVPDFAVFVFIGLTAWGLYSEIISGATGSILANAGLVKKVYLPREIFPLSAVGSAVVNFGIQSVVLIVGIVALSPIPLGPNLLYAPVALLMLVTFATAFGLLLAAVNVYLRDVQHFVEIYLLVFFWLSPIVYPFSFVHNVLAGGILEELYLANPVTVAVISLQRALWGGATVPVNGQLPSWPANLEVRLLVMLVIGLVLVWLFQRVFARLQGNFAQEL